MSDTKQDIIRVSNNTRDLLLTKNDAYGDSALNPIGVFGHLDARTSLGARMDDKLMRLKSLQMGSEAVDTLYDLQGYITLMIIAIERAEGIDSFNQVCETDSNTSEIINGKSLQTK